MPTLLHDRYVTTEPDRACDLATGANVPLETLTPPASRCEAAELSALFDALDYAREGQPQRMAVEPRGNLERRVCADMVATGAQQRGYVPVAVDLYRQARGVLTDELRDRALVLIDAVGADAEALACLMDAAARSSRPHMLVAIEPPRGRVVREARAVFGGKSARLLQSVHPEVVRLQTRAARAPEFVLAGRHASAERLLREVISALERRRACAEASRVTIGLGRMLFERGRVREADSCGGDAVRLADLAQDVALSCEAHLVQAWARIEQRRIVEAESIARAVLVCAPDAGMAACARATLARCLLDQGRTRELVTNEMDAGIGGQTEPHWTAVIHDVWAAVLIETGRLFDAGRRIRSAFDHWPGDAGPLATAILHTAHLRVVVATGDSRLAGDVLARALDSARQARAPVRAWRARAVWCAGMVRAGAADLIEAEMQRLRRTLLVAPPMLGHEVESVTRASQRGAVSRRADADPGVAAAMLALAQEDDDAAAVRAVLAFALTELDAARLDVVSAEAGPPTVVIAVGTGPASSVGQRVLESGIAIGFDQGCEAAVPVRLAARLVGALVARWPVGRTVPCGRKAVLECAAAVIAARVEGLHLHAREASAASVEIPELIGTGRVTTELRKAVLRAARAPFSVLIEGESGVGKELVARAIHHLSQRRERRFCDVNCAALPDELFETELFGHAKGAFTGAVAERAGLFEEAGGGTLFLDEVAELSPRAQAKLLRAVQQQEIRRVGESFARPVDVRFVAAANRQMSGEVEAGRFRADLLYRLDVIHIRIAPLRERPEDIPALAEHLWRQTSARVGSAATLTPGAIAALAHYSWPGNVRELQNVMAALAVAAPPRGRVRASLLPPVISAASGVSAGRLAPARDQFERRFIELALARAGGNRSRAARAIGLSRQGLLKSMARLGLRPQSDGCRD